MGIRGEVFTSKLAVGKRTYFFNVKENRQGDLFLNLVESKKQNDIAFERHSVVVFEEDIDVFAEEFQKAIAYVQKNKKS